jgi:hypothetical protein
MLADSWALNLSDFATDRPVWRAWTRDNCRTIFPTWEGTRTAFSWRLGRVIALGAAASLLIVVIAVSSVWREWSIARYTIETNSLPLADRGVSPGERTLESPSDTSNLPDREAPDELVQTDSTRPVEPPGVGVNSNAESKPAAPAHFGYDLEHGIPMPPDARDSKPVY